MGRGAGAVDPRGGHAQGAARGGAARTAAHEIRNLREALEATRAEALTDPLTGLANRRHFEEMLQKAIDQATLRREPFALVMADIDFFKRFNDMPMAI
jgi:diguanylate cyclase